MCAATGDAITIDGTADTVRVIQPEGSQVRLEDGSPASPVGELIDVIVKEVETANQSNNQGAADTRLGSLIIASSPVAVEAPVLSPGTSRECVTQQRRDSD